MSFWKKFRLGLAIAARVEMLQEMQPHVQEQGKALLEEVQAYAEVQAEARGLKAVWGVVNGIIKDIKKLI